MNTPGIEAGNAPNARQNEPRETPPEAMAPAI
jgi:hypothetical protein